MENTPMFGDYVRINLIKQTYEGFLLESSNEDKGIVLIKLNSGYNNGFYQKDILNIEVIKKGEIPKKESTELQKDSGGKPNIAIIMTGGTIGARLNPKKGGVDYINTPESLFKTYPEAFKDVNIKEVEVLFKKDSSDLDYKDWKKIAKTAEKFLNNSEIQGVIITHGTDTLHYTSSALSFFLKNVNKPVVLVYSQRSIDRASSDANLNLQCATTAVISDIAEVMIVGHATTNDDYCYAMPGAKVRKMHSSRRDAFKVINGKPYAKIIPGQITRISGYHLRSKGKVQLDLKFEAKLGWTKKLKEMTEKGMIICATTQTIYGRIDPLVYSAGRELYHTGIIYLEDMISETAFVKLGWVLGKTNDPKEVKELMLKSIAGELNYRLEE